jgi:archaemetzincin
MKRAARRSSCPLAVVVILVALGLACGPQPSEDKSQARSENPVFDDPSFTLLGPPPAGGWRTHVDEPGQSFAEYQAAQPNRPTPARKTLVLQPLGPYPRQAVLPEDLPSVKLEEDGLVTFVFSPTPDHLAAFLSSFYGLPTRVEPERPFASLGLASSRVRKHHAQFDARVLLSELEPALPQDAYSMTALVVRDLLVDDRQEFAFGYGLHVERLAVVSFAQLDPQFVGGERSSEFQTNIRERSYKLLAHEVGHTLGFGHCDVHECVMNGVANLDELDATPLRLCPVCLRKLLWLVEIDPLQRYRELAEHYEAHGLTTDLAWVRARIDRIGRISASAP